MTVHLVMSGEKVCGEASGGGVPLSMYIEVNCDTCRSIIRKSLDHAVR